MKLCSGTLLFLIIGLPWYLAMISLHGDAFTKTFLGTHNLLRATVSEHPRDNRHLLLYSCKYSGFVSLERVSAAVSVAEIQKTGKLAAA